MTLHVLPPNWIEVGKSATQFAVNLNDGIVSFGVPSSSDSIATYWIQTTLGSLLNHQSLSSKALFGNRISGGFPEDFRVADFSRVPCGQPTSPLVSIKDFARISSTI